jgi:hypothetical protein
MTPLVVLSVSRTISHLGIGKVVKVVGGASEFITHYDAKPAMAYRKLSWHVIAVLLGERKA